MPLHGFTRMFENMLRSSQHQGSCLIPIIARSKTSIPYKEMIFTGPVDEYFDYRYGKLPYRSLEFKHETLNQAVYQPVAVINYPNDYAYTRVTEFKYLTGQEHPRPALFTSISRAEGDPYYPIPRPENAELYKKYQALAEANQERPFRGTTRHLPLLQHGSGCGPGVDYLFPHLRMQSR